MSRFFKVAKETSYFHGFVVGQIVELIEEKPKGIYEVKGTYKISSNSEYQSLEVTQLLHKEDLEEVFEGVSIYE